ncbi:hypothetical protein KQI82_10535 [Oscillibacter sp. MSJ-2]|uniref:Uncharacterized protein n=1 Tax=Dysosmobacter acutus TaxID=2841504 RepID=A0ABS6FAN0_9FIRM|nr:hypothetical protein [Dysosmobacter acutus]MBU5627345.1 hypothetical protein [Dysosmobacter acutus]
METLLFGKLFPDFDDSMSAFRFFVETSIHWIGKSKIAVFFAANISDPQTHDLQAYTFDSPGGM